MTTLEQINKLADERHALWRKAGQRWREPHEAARIKAITAELASLWEKRRFELAGAEMTAKAS